MKCARSLCVVLGGVVLALAMCAGRSFARPQDVPQGEPEVTGQVEKPTAARGPRPMPLPALEESAQQLLSQDYLKDEERAALRVRHGQWEIADLLTAQVRAQTGLLRGAVSESALADASVSVETRAELMMKRGQPAEAIVLLGADASALARRLRAEAMVDLGQLKEAEKLLAELANDSANYADDADATAEVARGQILLARLRGAEGEGTVGYQQTLDMLARARDAVDRLSWRVPMAEALLLYEKDDYAAAAEALQATLELNPRLAEAWYLLGRMSADTFDFDRAERVALTLDMLAASEVPDEDASEYAPSALGRMVRVYTRLRQNEGAAALAELRPVLEAMPTHREARALEVAATALSFDFAGADALLRKFDELAMGSPLPAFVAGKALSSARQYDDAARLLRIASERSPMWAEPLIDLGLSELQAGKLDAARAALDRGLKLDRFNTRAQNSLTLLKEIEGYTTIESDHFVIRFKPGVDEILAREMLEPMERIYLRVTGNGSGGIRHTPSGKTVVELYPNHRWFATRITGMPALHTFAAATGPVIAMEVPRSGPGHMVGPYDWARVLQHEYVHTVTLSRTQNRLPHWFTEASAVYLEDAPDDFGSLQILARAAMSERWFDFDTINVMFVRPKRPSDRAQAYAQGAWMYRYIIEQFGDASVLELMDLYATGVREEEAFSRVLKISRAQFFEDFTVWAKTRLEKWGMVPTETNKNIEQLLGESGVEEFKKELLDQWHREQPENPFVLVEYIKAELDPKNETVTPELAELLRTYARLCPVDPMPHRLLAKYELTSSEGDASSRAIEHLEFLDAREQHSTSFALELARQYAKLAQWDKAIAKVTRATQISPYDATIRELAATIALRAGRPAVAEGHIIALTKLEPDKAVHQQRLEAVRKMLQN